VNRTGKRNLGLAMAVVADTTPGSNYVKE
jgi:hypothetical protein